MSSSNRESVVRGLRELADFLEQHPDVDAPEYVTVFVRDDDGDMAAIGRVNLAAWLLDVDATHSRGHHSAKRRFGGRYPDGLSFEVVHIETLRMEQYREQRSYTLNVQV